jgi:hypothetical protein
MISFASVSDVVSDSNIDVGVDDNFGSGVVSGSAVDVGVGSKLGSGMDVGVVSGSGVISGSKLGSGMDVGVVSGSDVDVDSGVGTSATGGRVATGVGLEVKINVVIPMTTTKNNPKIIVKRVSETLLEILDGKNKRNVCKNLSHPKNNLVKRLGFFTVVGGVSVSNLTTVFSKTPIVPRKN